MKDVHLVVSRALILFLGLFLSVCSLHAVEKNDLEALSSSEQTWTISLKEVEISTFVSQIATITGKTFVVDPRVKGKITVISSSPLDLPGVYALFQSILQVHGFAAIESGEFIKIIPNNNAKQTNLPVIDGQSITKPLHESLITEVITLKQTAAVELAPVLRPLLPQYGHIAAVASSNSLIISDHANNITRLRSIIDRVDSEEHQEIEVIQLEQAWATEILQLLENLEPVVISLPGRKGGVSKGSAMKRALVVADERTNRLILKGDRAARERIKVLVAKLDQPSQLSGSNKVIYLRHANATKVAQLLEGLTAAGESIAAGAKSKTKTTTPTTTTRIQADEALNALVIRADPAELAEIEGIIRQLDVRRAQVLIEAAIVEISSDSDQSVGIQWGSYDPEGNGIVGINFSNLTNSINSLLVATSDDSNLGAVGLGDGITLLAGEDNGDSGFGVLLQALAKASNTNLLSTPSIMTLDNEEATILVGQNVPFITGSSTSSASDTNNPFQTISREDVGVTLKVIPQINEGNVIRLQVEQEVSAVVPSTEVGTSSAADLITNKRAIQTTILADDGEIIVLGGLIQDDFTEVERKVPLLGDLPVVGKLFKSNSRAKVKRNLLVFLKPYIMRDGSQVADISKSKYQQIKSVMIGADQNGVFLLQPEKVKQELLPDTVEELFQPTFDIQD